MLMILDLFRLLFENFVVEMIIVTKKNIYKK